MVAHNYRVVGLNLFQLSGFQLFVVILKFLNAPFYLQQFGLGTSHLVVPDVLVYRTQTSTSRAPSSRPTLPTAIR